MWASTGWKDYELLDCGKGEKLERWGAYTLVRPDPQAINSSQEIDLKNGAEREKDLLGLAFATRDKQEGMEAFLARRPPRFQDF